MTDSCLVCHHFHMIITDYNEDKSGFIHYSKSCNMCHCKKAVTNNLELLEYKYEQNRINQII